MPPSSSAVARRALRVEIRGQAAVLGVPSNAERSGARPVVALVALGRNARLAAEMAAHSARFLVSKQAHTS